jgi:hypothetical protein
LAFCRFAEATRALGLRNVLATDREADMGKTPSDNDFTRHGQARCLQRNRRPQDARLLRDYGRRERSVGGGATSVMLDKQGRAELLDAGVAPDLVQRLGRYAVVLGEGGEVITILVPSRHRGRRYRHGLAARRHRPARR